jgi:hypothetical protein
MTAPVLSVPELKTCLDPQGASTHAISLASSKSADQLKYFCRKCPDSDIFVDVDTDNRLRRLDRLTDSGITTGDSSGVDQVLGRAEKVRRPKASSG